MLDPRCWMRDGGQANSNYGNSNVPGSATGPGLSVSTGGMGWFDSAGGFKYLRKYLNALLVFEG
jgi:hypothetical protein